MCITLDQLSPLLSEQYNALPKGSGIYLSYYSVKNFQIAVDREVIAVDVRMKKIELVTPKNEISISDPLKFTASVNMKPVNAKVWEACVAHFENQTRIDPIQGHNKQTFDSLQINGYQHPVRGYVIINDKIKAL